MIIKASAGDMFEAFNTVKPDTGFYKVVWNPGPDITFEAVELEKLESLLSLFVRWEIGEIRNKSIDGKKNLALMFFNLFGSKPTDSSFYVAMWLNEPGIEKALYFLTLEENHYMRFVEGWKRLINE